MKEHDLYKEIADDMILDMKNIEKRCLLKEGKVVDMKKYKPLRKKTIGIVAGIACIVLICMPVMAKELTKLWDNTVATMFDADKKIQENYQNTKLTQVFEKNETEKTESNKSEDVIIAENNGVTVTLKQTLTDDYSMYIYLDVKTDGRFTLTDENLFKDIVLYMDGTVWNGYENFSGGFVSDEYAISDYERGLELRYLNSDGINLTGHDIKLDLSELQVDTGKLNMQTIVEGSWSLQWKVTGQYCGIVKTVDLNDTVLDVNGGTYTLTEIDISPISYYIHYDNQGVNSFDAGPLHVAFIMNDGTIYDDENDYSEDRMLAGGGGSTNNNGEFMSFVKVLNLSELKAIRINGTVFELN